MVGDESIPVVHEHAPPSARPAGRKDQVAIEEIEVLGRALDVGIDDLARETRIRHDGLEVVHEVVFAHGR